MPGATPVLALPYPVPDDSVDVPRDVKALADKLDTYTSLRPPLVSSLPGTPADGQECYYLADATNGVIWHLRYRAGASGIYKWEVIGGAPLAAEDLTAFQTGSQSYVNCGPTLTAPLVGDYIIVQGATIEGYGTGWRGRVAYNGNDNEGVYAAGQGANANADAAGVSRSLRRTLTASAYTLKARSDAANNLNFGFRFLQFEPVRVG